MSDEPSKMVGDGPIVEQWNKLVAKVAALEAMTGGIQGQGVTSFRGPTGDAIAVPAIPELEAFRVPLVGSATVGTSFDLGTTPVELERLIRARTGEHTITATPATVRVWAPPWWKGSAIPGDLVLCERRGGRWRGLAGGRQVVKVTLLPPGFTAGSTATLTADGQVEGTLLRIHRGDLLPTSDSLVGVAWASWHEALMRWEVTGAPC